MPSLYIISALILWSSVGIFVRFVELPVHVIIFYSLSFSIIYHSLLLLIPALRKQMPGVKDIPYISVLSLFILTNTLTFLFAYTKTTISNAVFSHYIAPVLVAIFAPLFLKEKVTYKVFLSIALSMAGLWIMVKSSDSGVTVSESFSPSSHATGIVSALISGVAYASLIMIVRVYSKRYNQFAMVFIQNIFIVILLTPFVDIFPADKLPVLAVMGGLHSTLAPALYYMGIKHVEAHKAAVLGYIEPVSAVLLGMIILSEYPTIYSLLGGLLILSSGYIVIRGN